MRPRESIRVMALSGLVVPAGAWAGDLSVEVRDRDGHPVQDVVILIQPVDGRRIPPPLRPRQEIDQIHQEFVPFVKVVPAGTDVYFPNKDDMRHQVYSFSPAKHFELPLYAGRSAPPVRFDKPGIVVLGCNIHDWMLAYVYVTEAPFYGQTSAQGRAAISNLPAGDYLAHLWHPRQKESEAETSRRFTAPAQGPVNLEWRVTLRAENRPRRHAVSGAGDYR